VKQRRPSSRQIRQKTPQEKVEVVVRMHVVTGPLSAAWEWLCRRLLGGVDPKNINASRSPRGALSLRTARRLYLEDNHGHP
jgi:hypothetical protein